MIEEEEKGGDEGANQIKKSNQKGTAAIVESTLMTISKMSEAGKKKTDQSKKEAKETADEMAELSIALAEAVASTTMAIIGAFSNARNEKFFAEMDALEEQVNERLAEYQEERRLEEERIKEEKREREYEEAMQALDRSIGNLEHQFAQETSAKKKAAIADQIEQENKKKVEERKKREEELAEKERKKQELMDLYEFELEKHEIEVQRVERENKMAEQEKYQRIAQVLVDTSVGIATAWANSASLGTFWFGPVFTGIMTGIAAAQTAAIASQNVKKPLPVAPKPPKFREGGVIGNHGEQGINAVIGDGVSEVILPLTADTFDHFGDGVVGALGRAMEEKGSFMEALGKDLNGMNETATQIHIENLNNIYNNNNHVTITQNNNIPINCENSSEISSQMEEVAVKICREIKENLRAGVAFDEALLSRSRGVLNALKDQGDFVK